MTDAADCDFRGEIRQTEAAYLERLRQWVDKAILAEQAEQEAWLARQQEAVDKIDAAFRKQRDYLEALRKNRSTDAS
jgi:hypothetical protein